MTFCSKVVGRFYLYSVLIPTPSCPAASAGEAKAEPTTVTPLAGKEITKCEVADPDISELESAESEVGDSPDPIYEPSEDLYYNGSDSEFVSWDGVCQINAAAALDFVLASSPEEHQGLNFEESDLDLDFVRLCFDAPARKPFKTTVSEIHMWRKLQRIRR